MLILKEVVSSELGFGGDLTEGVLRGILLVDALHLDELAIIPGDVWEAWAFNGSTFEASVYSGYDFNSYADDEEGQIYAANESGIFILSGDTDAGEAIHSGVILSPTMFGLMNRKRFRRAFLDVTGTLPIIRGEVGGLGVSLPVVRERTMFPRILVGNKWTFLIADFDELGRVELFPVVVTR